MMINNQIIDFLSVASSEITALYLLEAIYKSSPERALLVITADDRLHASEKWDSLKIKLMAFSNSEIVRLIEKISQQDPVALRICQAEVDYDYFFSDYEHLFLQMDQEGWYWSDPKGILNQIDAFTDGFRVPRVRLLLLLKYASFADSFDSNDLHLVCDVYEEIQKELLKMPVSVLERPSERFFFRNGYQRLAEFIENL